MEYLLIIVLQLLGIGFHVMQKIVSLGDTCKECTRKDVISAFFKEDWDTLVVSILVLVSNLVIHYIVDTYAHSLRDSTQYYILYAFGLAFVLGYAGQRLVYKWLGSAEKRLTNEIDNKLK